MLGANVFLSFLFMPPPINDLPISSLDAPLSAALNKVVRNSTRAGTKVLHQPAYILHSYPLSETSLVLDVLVREHGRLLIVAKGAKRPYTRWRASIFQTFQTLSIGFSGKGSVRTLLDAEWVGGIPMLPGAALMSGYYMNEWLQRALVYADAHAGLFDAYQRSLAELSLHAHTASEQAQVLRGFEWSLLCELGFGFDCSMLSGDDALNEYYYQFDVSAHRWSKLTTYDMNASVMSPNQIVVSGQTLVDIRANDFQQTRTQHEARQLFQAMLAQYVLDKPLLTRQLARELHELQKLATDAPIYSEKELA